MESHVDFGILFDQGLEFLDDGMGILGFYRRLCNLLDEPAFDDSLIAWQPTANSMFDNNGHVNLLRQAVSSGQYIKRRCD